MVKYLLYILNSGLLASNSILAGINYTNNSTPALYINIGAIVIALVGVFFTCKVWYIRGQIDELKRR